MINKFKDFLKKFSRKRDDDFSDQDEFLDDEALDENLSDEEPPVEFGNEDLTGETELPPLSDEDHTGEFQAPAARSSWKDKFKISLPKFKKKTKSEDLESSLPALSDEDATGETPLPSFKPSWKDKFTQGLSGLKSKIPAIKVKDWKIPERVKNNSKDSVFTLSPSLSKNIERFLSRGARETIHQISLVVIICLVTYSVGKLTALGLKGAPPQDSARNYSVSVDLDQNFNPQTLNQVKSINIFRTNTGLGGPKKVADTKCNEAQSASNLPIKLVNTVVLQDEVKSLASVQVRGDRDLKEVRVGDQISNLAKIFKINRLEIVIKNLESGICESISSDKLRESRSPISVMSPSQSRQYVATKKMPGIENEGNKFKISKTLLDEKMKDIAAILTQARAIKIQNPDGSMAFKLTELDPQGIFPYLGLQDQDIITSINGKPIYDINEVMSLFGKIKNLDKLQLGIRRDGSESNLDYNINK